MRTLSYKNVVELAIEDPETVDALVDVVEQHKNWGGYTTRIPSHVVVLLLDCLKALAEQQLGDAVPIEIEGEE